MGYKLKKGEKRVEVTIKVQVTVPVNADTGEPLSDEEAELLAYELAADHLAEGGSATHEEAEVIDEGM